MPAQHRLHQGQGWAQAGQSVRRLRGEDGRQRTRHEQAHGPVVERLGERQAMVHEVVPVDQGAHVERLGLRAAAGRARSASSDAGSRRAPMLPLSTASRAWGEFARSSASRRPPARDAWRGGEAPRSTGAPTPGRWAEAGRTRARDWRRAPRPRRRPPATPAKPRCRPAWTGRGAPRSRAGPGAALARGAIRSGRHLEGPRAGRAPRASREGRLGPRLRADEGRASRAADAGQHARALDGDGDPHHLAGVGGEASGEGRAAHGLGGRSGERVQAAAVVVAEVGAAPVAEGDDGPSRRGRAALGV